MLKVKIGMLEAGSWIVGDDFVQEKIWRYLAKPFSHLVVKNNVSSYFKMVRTFDDWSAPGTSF
jgi:hypothetical protein